MVARTKTDTDDVFSLPDLGEGLEEAVLVEWSVHVGQTVKEGDILAKMETAKALVDVASPRAGVIALLHAEPGQTVKVGASLVSFRAKSAGSNGGRPAPAAEAPRQIAPRLAEHAAAEPQPDAGTVVGNLSESAAPAEARVLATPAERRLARELGVDLEHIRGTGIGGRITAEDVRAAVGGGAAAEPRPADAQAERIPFRGVRRTIAEHLHHSITQAVHFTIMDEADITALDNLRRKLMAASNEKITVLPFVASAVCRVLAGKAGAAFTRLNCSVDDEKQEIVQHKTIHLGIATDTENGLMVPVIREADRMGLMELSRAIARLAAAARDRSIPVEELRGSTFTISNFGSIGGRFGTPIINYPEVAVLSLGRVRDGVVVRDGMLGVGRLLPLSLSADHRVIDGATAATALARIMECLSRPEELLAPVR